MDKALNKSTRNPIANSGKGKRSELPTLHQIQYTESYLYFYKSNNYQYLMGT